MMAESVESLDLESPDLTLSGCDERRDHDVAVAVGSGEQSTCCLPLVGESRR